MNRPWIPALLLLAACGSTGPKGDDLGGPAPGFPGFPATTTEDIVYAEATYPKDSKAVFGVDLPGREQIVPIFLSVKLQGAGAGQRQILLDSDAIGALLYLQDGTALELLSVDQVAEAVGKRSAPLIRELGMTWGMLQSSGTKSGFLFFRLSPKKAFKVKGRSVVHASFGRKKTLDLANSLLSFTVTMDNTPVPFFVGIEG